MDDELLDFGLVSYVTLDDTISSAAPAHIKTSEARLIFLSLLGLVQHLQIDLIPITWHSVLESARRGRTAEIQQMAIDLQSAFAFKRLAAERPESRSKDLLALMAEVAVLGHPAVRQHPNLVTLEGVCWDVVSGTEEVWPVLLFEKATYGDLMSFMERGPGKSLTISERLKLCGDIAVAIADMHRNSIIHGDIKPQNVLVFNEDTTSYTAKVTDFGYSVIYASVDAQIQMPATPFWVAPEWQLGKSSTDPQGAQMMDIFSLADVLAERQKGEDLSNIAVHFVDECGELDDLTKQNLRYFFKHSLQSEPSLRRPKHGTLLDCIIPECSKQRQLAPILIQGTETLLMPNFQIADSICHLFLADYRVRKFIFNSLKEQVELKSGIGRSGIPRQNSMALELALCYAIGFGTERDDDKSRLIQREFGISEQEIQNKLTEIKQGSSNPIFRSVMYGDLVKNGRDFRVNFSDRYRAENKLAEALSWYEREAMDLESVFGSMMILTLIVRTELFYHLRVSGRWDDAIALRIQITDLMRSAWGLDNHDTLASMSQLAAIYIDRGLLDDAESLFEEVLEVQKKNLGPEHPQVLESINGLSGVYKAKGHYGQAEEILLPAIGIRKKLLGATHPDTLRLISSLAATYVSAERQEEAESLLKDLVENRKARLGLKSGYTLTSMSGLAGVYYHQEKLEDARELWQQVCDLRTTLFGEGHPETLMVLNNLAVVENRLGNCEEATKKHEQIIRGKIETLGEDSKSTWKSRGNLALAYANQQRWEEAIDLGRKVVDAKRRVEGPDHPSTLASIVNLADAMEEIGEREAAKAELRQGMEDAIAAGRIEEPRTKDIMNMLLYLTES